MALDPSIIAGIRPVQIDSPVNALAQVLKVQSLQQEGQLGQAKLDEYQRTKARQNKLLDLVQSLPAGTTDGQRIDALKGGGYFDEADKLQTGMLNRRKIESEAKDKEWAAQSKKLDLAGQAFGYVRQNPTLDAANQVLDYLGQNGVYSPETVAQYKATVAADPSKIGALAETAFRTVLDAKEQLMKVDTRNLGGTTQTVGTDPLTGKTTVLATAKNTQSPDNAATVAATIRGQNMTDTRAREQLEQGKSQVVQSDNGPVLVNTKTGAGKTITGPDGQPLPGVTKPLNDSQSKALLFGTRMQEADKILGQLATEGTTTSIPGSRAPFIGGAISALSSDNRQMLDQAKRDFINATLRRESGAAISSGEFENGEKQYFPQIGEGEKVIAQKARNRQLAMKGVLAEVPEKQRGSITPPATPAALPPKNAKGWTLHVDAAGNKAYVAPNGKDYEEVH